VIITDYNEMTKGTREQ